MLPRFAWRRVRSRPISFALPPLRAISSALSDRARTLASRHASVSEALSATTLDQKARTRLGRELSELDKVVDAVAVFTRAADEVASLEALVSAGAAAGDEDSRALAALAREELSGAAQPALDAAEALLTRLLLPRDEADSRDVILEVRAGVGGDEAALFASELLALYEAYAASKGWSWSPLIVTQEAEYGGVREAVIAVAGDGAFGRLKFESGVHRVQRVPVTQSTGLLQTSTATVAVLPEAEEVDVVIRPAELRIDTYRAQGAGGQHVNTTDSAVRITHLPTGIVVAIQDERSQTQNRVKAMRVLRARIFDRERERIESERRRERNSQVGSSARSDRVRTYNFTQNRITDHRVGLSKHNVDAMMKGECLDEFIDALEDASKEEQLKALVSEDAETAAAATPKKK